jgi:hypothetical protein
MSSIVIDPNILLIVLNGLPIRDFPATGTILEIAQGQPTSTYEPSFGRDAYIFGPEWWTISVSVQAGGESDNIFEASHAAFMKFKSLCSLSASLGPKPIVSSVSLGFTALPNIVYAADSFPMRTWVLTGKCSGPPSAGIYTPASTLTQEQVEEFLP